MIATAWAHDRLGRADKSKPAALDDDTRKQFEKMGVQVTAAPDVEDNIQIMANAWDSYIAFRACETQWRMVIGLSGLIWLGLDYSACKLVLDDIGAPAHAFADLRYMEAAALRVLNEVDG
ncbi:DUF1799 domain-containing protein [Agrobacterium pusense]|uniref:DUF1799 domain-containing protein n=1 Tax=Agrobacterium pusense TaxID=648995 RepID=UPI000D1BB4C0|nr:DUF1799 domain-containing protein [Agrobacterium pusense]